MRVQRIMIEVFGKEIILFDGTKEELIKWVKKHIGVKDVIDLIEEYDESERTALTYSCGGNSIIWCYKNKSFGTFAHEIFHAVYRMLDQIGVILSDTSHEAFAYLMGYVYDEAYKFINESNKD